MANNKQSAIPHYEMLYIVPNKYTENDVEDIKKSVMKLIEDNDGKITFSEDWGKKKFCFPIKHTMHGYYLLVEFDMVSTGIKKVENELRMNSQVLRHMTVNTINKTDEQRQIERDRFEAQKREKQESRKAERAPKKEVKKVEKKEVKKVDSKELDDKLNKILNTDDLL